MVDLNEKRYISKQERRKATGFKSLPINRQEVDQVTSNAKQIFWTKLAIKGLKQKKRTSPSNFANLKQSRYEIST